MNDDLKSLVAWIKNDDCNNCSISINDAFRRWCLLAGLAVILLKFCLLKLLIWEVKVHEFFCQARAVFFGRGADAETDADVVVVIPCAAKLATAASGQ